MFSRNRPDDDFEPTQCPVCRTLFGQRAKTKIFKAHCNECRATYWWKPWAERPNAVLDSAPKERKYCDKSGCYCRD